MHENECRNTYPIHVQLEVNCGIKEFFAQFHMANVCIEDLIVPRGKRPGTGTDEVVTVCT